MNSQIIVELQTVGDAVRCLALVDSYRRAVESGEMCGGDCPEEGAGCQSGVCRARLRSVEKWSITIPIVTNNA